MVFDAHDHAFRLFGGACRRGIYDNMTTAVDAVFVGKERRFNRRFLRMCSHYLVEPTACTPAAGWEKGQVENQVGNIARALVHAAAALCRATPSSTPGWRRAASPRRARARIPSRRDKTVWEVFEAERASLIAYRGPFDGFREVEVAVSKSSLVRFDHNRYSVAVKAARRTAQLRVYADRVVVWCDGEIVGEHARRFGRGQTAYDPWHYLPVLARKPGALRNGDPFRNWDLPPALAQVRRRLAGHDDGDRQFVDILTAVAEAGLEAVEAACAEALSAKLCGRDVVLNILARQRDADAARAGGDAGGVGAGDRAGGRLRPLRPAAPSACRPRRPTVERHEIMELLGQLKLAGMRAAYDEVVAAGLRAPAFLSAHLRRIAARPARRQSRPLDRLPHGGGALPGDEEPRRVRLLGLAGQPGAGARAARGRLSRHPAQRRADRRHRHRQEPSSP